jgi:hypothetical protein
MKKAIILSGLLLAVTASFAAAQGINLALTDCGSFGAVNAAANCATNTGVAMSIVGSCIPPAGLDRVVGVEGYIDGQTSAATLSPWWTLDGACRGTAMSFSFDFSANSNCNDFWGGQASGGGGISPVHTAANRFQIKLAGATVLENPIDPGVEHYMFKVNINRSKSTGTGACAGCTDAACLVLNRMNVVQPAGAIGGDAVITLPILNNYVTYNNGVVGGGPNGGSGCPGATPSQNRTWGQVKSLYR